MCFVYEFRDKRVRSWRLRAEMHSGMSRHKAGLGGHWTLRVLIQPDPLCGSGGLIFFFFGIINVQLHEQHYGY